MSILIALRTTLWTIQANALRSVLTIGAVGIGVAAIIAMLAVGQGARQQVADQMRALGSELIVVLPGSQLRGGVHLGYGSLQSLTEEDAAAIESELRFVASASPTVSTTAQVVHGRKNWSTNVAGIVPAYLSARDWSLAAGAAFDLHAVERTAKVAILGRTVVRRLFGDADPVGRTVRIESVPFLVVGVLNGKGHSASGRDEDDRVFIPVSTAKRRLIGERYQVDRSAVDFILVKARAAEATARVTAEIGKLLRQRHALRPGQADDFIVRDLSAIQSIQEESSRALALLLGFVASVSLVVSGFGVMNTMLASIAERTREIGLRLALGAKRKDLSRQFLTEAAVHFLIGGLAGLPTGALAAAAIAQFAGWPVMLTAGSFALAIVFSAILGLVFGAYPARKAAGLSPIEALRWE